MTLIKKINYLLKQKKFKTLKNKKKNYKYQFILSSFHKKEIEKIIKLLTNSIKNFNITYKIITLKPKIKKITIIKSPHIYKKSREQIQLKTYKIIFQLKSSQLNLNIFTKYIKKLQLTTIGIKIIKYF